MKPHPDIRVSTGPTQPDGTLTLNVSLRRGTVWRTRLGCKLLVLALRVMPSLVRAPLIARLSVDGTA